MTAARIGKWARCAWAVSASSVRPSALPWGDWYERKTDSERRTSLAGSPSARDTPATAPAIAAATASTASRFTASSEAGGSRRHRRPHPPRTRRIRRGGGPRRSSGGVVDEEHLEGRGARQRDLEVHGPVSDHHEGGRGTLERPGTPLRELIGELAHRHVQHVEASDDGRTLHRFAVTRDLHSERVRQRGAVRIDVESEAIAAVLHDVGDLPRPDARVHVPEPRERLGGRGQAGEEAGREDGREDEDDLAGDEASQ